MKKSLNLLIENFQKSFNIYDELVQNIEKEVKHYKIIAMTRFRNIKDNMCKKLLDYYVDGGNLLFLMEKYRYGISSKNIE